MLLLLSFLQIPPNHLNKSNIHRHRLPFTFKNEDDDLECKKIFRSIAIKKKEYEDRRLSLSNNARQTRIDRLMKSLKTF